MFIYKKLNYIELYLYINLNQIIFTTHSNKFFE